MNELNDSPTLNDLGITYYELLNSSSRRWEYDPHFIGPLHQEQPPLDESMLEDIDNALDTRIYHRKKRYYQRWHNMNYNPQVMQTLQQP